MGAAAAANRDIVPRMCRPSDQRRRRSVVTGLVAGLGLSLLAGATPRAVAKDSHAGPTEPPAAAVESEPPAELAVRGARIITMDPARPMATALAVREGRIVYVGDDAGLAAHLGKSTRVLSGESGEGVTVLPGLIDAHAHLVGLGLSLEQLDLRGLTSAEDIVTAVKGAAEKAKPGAWIIGRGWDQNRFPGGALPSVEQRKLLDQAAPGHPVLLKRIDGHAAWVNAEALRHGGISARTEIAGGRILRDLRGEPTGVLIDNAIDPIDRKIPAPEGSELEHAILAAAEHVAARGIVAVHDMGIGASELAAYQRLVETHRLPIRVFAFHSDPIPAALSQLPNSLAYKAELERLRERLGPPISGPMLTVRGIKLYMDGALGSRGAALLAPYSDDPKNSGLLLTTPQHIESMARWAMLYGYQLATHAIGDRAVRLVLDAYEQAGVRADKNLRFRIEHAQVVSPDTLRRRRFQTLGVIASVQPTHATSDMPWAPARLGSERIRTAYAWQGLLHSGARLCAGSDFPVEEADPRLGLFAAVFRKNLEGQPPAGFYADQSLSLGEAIRAFTTDAAYAAFAEDGQGRISVGWAADLSLFGGKLELEAPAPADLAKRPVLMTVVGGQVIYDRDAEKKPAQKPQSHARARSRQRG